MKWAGILRTFGTMPLFHTSMLAVFSEDIRSVRVQLSRWVEAGKLIRVRREWYLIAKPWFPGDVPAAFIASKIVQPSYLSMEWALRHHGLIPEAVPNPTSVTTDRPIVIRALGREFLYHHIQPALLTGFREVDVGGWVVPSASPEKALFDMVYFFVQRRAFSKAWIAALRLQNLEDFDVAAFSAFAGRSDKWGLREAVREAAAYVEEARE